MDILNSYGFIIAFAIIIILSYLYNVLAKRTNVPSVLMLIVTGVIIQIGTKQLNWETPDLMPALEILGIVGLIMIVLEAALDLRLRREKFGMIARALGVAAFALVGCTFAISFVMNFFIEIERLQALIYATPLAILSSAIIIPSVENLIDEKREFLIYEGTFSDILGIMQFYFLLSYGESGALGNAAAGFAGGFILTVVIAVVASYILVLVFQRIRSNVKLFLLISILLLLYSVGKLLHLSPLIIILVFGVMLTNRHIFFPGSIAGWIDTDRVEQIEREFHMITMETAFLVRTFFFVVFGMTLVLSSLLDIKALLLSALILVFIYGIRTAFLRLFSWKGSIMPEALIAPRGLITILLFFAIPVAMQSSAFNEGILLYVIIVTNVVMTMALVRDARSRAQQAAIAGQDAVAAPEPEVAPALNEAEEADAISSGDTDDPGSDQEPDALPDPGVQ